MCIKYLSVKILILIFFTQHTQCLETSIIRYKVFLTVTVVGTLMFCTSNKCFNTSNREFIVQTSKGFECLHSGLNIQPKITEILDHVFFNIGVVKSFSSQSYKTEREAFLFSNKLHCNELDHQFTVYSFYGLFDLRLSVRSTVYYYLCNHACDIFVRVNILITQLNGYCL